MGRYVLGLEGVDQGQVALVGGKGAGLGELSRIEGVRVPAAFCVTTDAFRRVLADVPSIDDRLDQLSHVEPDDREGFERSARGSDVPSNRSPSRRMWRPRSHGR